MTHFDFVPERRGTGKRMAAGEREDKRAKALAMVDQGLSRAQISERLGLSPNAISAILKGTGAQRLERGKERYGLAAVHDQLVKRWAEGATATDLAIEFNATRNAVCGYVHRNRAAFGSRGVSKIKGISRVRRQVESFAPSLSFSRAGIARSALTGAPTAARLTKAELAQALGTELIERVQCKGGQALMDSNFLLSGSARADGSKREGVALMDLKHGCCRWGVNAPEKGGLHLFCGEVAREGKPYCAEHEAYAYTTQAEAAENVRRFKERKQTELRNIRLAVAKKYQVAG